MSTNLVKQNLSLFARANLKLYQDEEGKSRKATLDGPITDQYFTADTKILWIMREVHGQGNARSLISDVNEDLIGRDKPYWPKWYSTWGLIIKVSHAILDNKLIMSTQRPRILKRCLERIAVINLNKFGGGGNKSKHYWKGAKICRDLVKNQYKKFSPDIVILGGTGQDFIYLDLDNLDQKDFSPHKNKFPSLNKNNVTFISAYHPGQRSISHLTYCDNICNEFKR